MAPGYAVRLLYSAASESDFVGRARGGSEYAYCSHVFCPKALLCVFTLDIIFISLRTLFPFLDYG
jgi:hypothetical protein